MDGAEHGAEESAGSQLGDGDDGDGGARTPVWPPADATLAQVEDWLEALRRLLEDDAILSRQVILSRRIGDLRRPLPAPPRSLLPSS